MKRILDYWREIAATCVATVLAALIGWWARKTPQTSLGRFVCVGGMLLCCYILWRLLRSLWREKWSAFFERLVDRALEKIARGMSRFFNFLCRKFGVNRKQRDRTIGGKTKITFDTHLFEREEKKGKKNLKWKHMETDRQRLGYLYRHMIRQKIRGGTAVYRYETPEEVRVRCENREEEEELLAFYPDLRYDDRREVDEKRIEEFRERFHIH